MDGGDLATAKTEAVRRGIGAYDRHVFICTGPDCCSEEEGKTAWAALKRGVAGLNGSSERGRIYRTKVGCLRICHEGPVAVVYPEGTWYAGLDPANLARVIESDLGRGVRVDDLVIGENPLGSTKAQES